MDTETPVFQFKHFSNGQAIGLKAQDGSVSQAGITLGDHTIPMTDILGTTVRGNVLVFAVNEAAIMDDKLAKRINRGALVVQIYKLDAIEVEKAIDRHSSQQKAQVRQQQMQLDGTGEQFRSHVCPNCTSTIDVTDFDQSSSVFCGYCETVFSNSGQIETLGYDYKTCQDCGGFDRNREYTFFQFFFIVIAYAYNHSKHYLCDACAHTKAKRSLLTNSIFLLGVPQAIRNIRKSQTNREDGLEELGNLNAAAIQGDIQEATDTKARLNPMFQEHPGVLYNMGLANLRSGDTSNAKAWFSQSLNQCSNYSPSLQVQWMLDNQQQVDFDATDDTQGHLVS